MNKLKFLIHIALFIALTSCNSSSNENVWVVGTSSDNPPYEFVEEGKLVGFDIDLMQAIGKYLNKEIEFRDMDFSGIIPALSSKNIDMAIAGISHTIARKKHVDFSIPYTEAGVTVLYRKDEGIKDIGDLKGKIIGAQLGTIWAIIAQDLSTEYQLHVKILANNMMLLKELDNHNIDAIFLENAQVEKLVSKYPYLAGFFLLKYSSSFSVVFPINTKYKGEVDSAITYLKDKGIIKELAKKWRILGE